MTEQLTRRQLRAARLADGTVPEAPAATGVAGDDATLVTSVSVDADPHREFQLSAPFASAESSSSAQDTDASSPAVGAEPVLSPDELLRKFRERIRNNYQDGSIPVPQAKLPASVSNPVPENYSFDIDAIRDRLRAAAEAARIQSQAENSLETLQPETHHDSEPLAEISEFDIAARQSASSLQVEALRESFAGYTESPAIESPALSSVETDSGIIETSEEISRRKLRRSSETEAVPAPFSPEAEGLVEVDSESLESNSAPSLVQEDSAADSDSNQVTDFQGKNLLAEPSTQSIVLDAIPDAVTMPINLSADGLTTGSISIIPEQSVSDVTGAIAGIKTDESTLKDTVTGAVSVIEPVSALAVIAERRHHAVLPMTSLRRGWWQPYAVAVGIFAMIGAAAYAVFLILEVLNS